MSKAAFLPMIALVLAVIATPALAGPGGNSFSTGLGEFMNCLVSTMPRQTR